MYRIPDTNKKKKREREREVATDSPYLNAVVQGRGSPMRRKQRFQRLVLPHRPMSSPFYGEMRKKMRALPTSYSTNSVSKPSILVTAFPPGSFLSPLLCFVSFASFLQYNIDGTSEWPSSHTIPQHDLIFLFILINLYFLNILFQKLTIRDLNIKKYYSL